MHFSKPLIVGTGTLCPILTRLVHLLLRSRSRSIFCVHHTLEHIQKENGFSVIAVLEHLLLRVVRTICTVLEHRWNAILYVFIDFCKLLSFSSLKCACVWHATQRRSLGLHVLDVACHTFEVYAEIELRVVYPYGRSVVW